MTSFTIRRLRCSLYFAAGGIGIGAWAASLPLVSQSVGLDKGQLGIILLCFALGAIILMVSIGRFLDRMQTPTTLSFAGSVVFGLSVACVPFLTTPVLLGLTVVVAGAGFGMLDVSMNTEASALEISSKRHLMSSFHAVFSLGNILGAFLVGMLVQHGGGVVECLGAAGTIVVAVSVCGRVVSSFAKIPVLEHHQALASKEENAFSRSQRILIVVLGAVAFFALLAEGGMMDWTSVYMVSDLGASESVGAYAFAIFAAAMTIGRLLGDAATKRFGHISILTGGSLICATSIAVILAFQNANITLVALGLCGLGVSNMVPAVFASAGLAGGQSAGRAMSIVTTMGYSGLLLGPAFLGFLAEATSLSFSFGAITLAFLIISLSTLVLRGLYRAQSELSPRAIS